MAHYKSKADMYEGRANRSEKDAKMHWAKAKNGEGDYHYGKAKKCYSEADRNNKIAKDIRKKGENVVFGQKKK